MSNIDNTTQARAQAMWNSMTESEKTGVRFGLLPADKMADIVVEGFDDIRTMTLALFECAKKDGGMRA